MSRNQSLISDFSEYYRWSQRTKIKYKLHYGRWGDVLQKARHIWATSWENLFMPYANNKGTDQSARTCRLISTFVIHCLDSIIPLVSISEISSLYLAFVAAQAGLSQPSLQTSKTGCLVSRLIIIWVNSNINVQDETCINVVESHKYFENL